MNNLSWFIYFAGMVDTLLNFTCFFAVAGGFVYLMFMIIMGAVIPTLDESDAKAAKGARWNISMIAVPILAFCIPASLFVPSRQTMVLMASSELGEKAWKSETVQSVVNPDMDLVKETEKLMKKEGK